MITIDCYSDKDNDQEICIDKNGQRKEKSLDLVIRAAYQNYKDTKKMTIGKPPLPLNTGKHSRNRSPLMGENTLKILR